MAKSDSRSLSMTHEVFKIRYVGDNIMYNFLYRKVMVEVKELETLNCWDS